jgi:hypothetical protein
LRNNRITPFSSLNLQQQIGCVVVVRSDLCSWNLQLATKTTQIINDVGGSIEALHITNSIDPLSTSLGNICLQFKNK